MKNSFIGGCLDGVKRPFLKFKGVNCLVIKNWESGEFEFNNKCHLNSAQYLAPKIYIKKL